METSAAGLEPEQPASGSKPVATGPEYRRLLDYWRALARQGRVSVEKLDGDMIAARWPYAMLLRVPPGGIVDIIQVFAPACDANGTGAETGVCAQNPFARDQASQISSWVLQVAQDAVGCHQPSRHQETFYQAGRARCLLAELLPCHVEGDRAAYLLLHLQDA
ncbi:hypothetical protein CKO21_03320 [Rhodovibrio salinarum]|uniref:Uncharacterized protein n=2 Tax=Rhodovibrio salinarum TaxID=1087 RepID=A0A934QGU5_9PROT|nr:hypothetical protein [Rhodovibrio salinarum]